MSIVITRNINMDFQTGEQKTRALHNINIEVTKQQLTMLVGPSGCGKTTLLSIITGILTPTEGKVFINGIDMFNLPDRQRVLLRRKKIGFIFQQYNLLPTLTAAENAAIPLIAAGTPLDIAKQQAIEVLTKIKMAEHVNKTPNKLSGGQQQRVAIARALVHQPELIICDEPTSALDEHTGMKIMQILKELSCEPNKGVIVVTHDNRIFQFADRIIRMNDGKIVNYE